MQRMLYVAPENPRAVLIMLPGGNGMVEFGPDGGIRRGGNGFLLRTLPLWQAQGLAVAVLTPPNGMSLLGYRHTPTYAAAAPRKEILYVESTALKGQPCGAEAPHGYFGIEPEAVERVAQWITATQR
jgi:hypothetical protein